MLEYIGGLYLMAFGAIYLVLLLYMHGIINLPPDAFYPLAQLGNILFYVAPVAAIAGIAGWYVDRESASAASVLVAGSALAFIPSFMNALFSRADPSSLATSLFFLAPVAACLTLSIYGLTAIKASAKPHALLWDEGAAQRRILRMANAIAPEGGPRKNRRILRRAA